MGAFSIWHWLVVLLLVVLLFGRGKISEVMGDVAKGIKSFKKGLTEDEDKTEDTAKDKPALKDESKTSLQNQQAEEKTTH
ncbi:MAG: twin-arginine translocase TatA/TatE family subunit [Sphingomonadales bacterium]